MPKEALTPPSMLAEPKVDKSEDGKEEVAATNATVAAVVDPWDNKHRDVIVEKLPKIGAWSKKVFGNDMDDFLHNTHDGEVRSDANKNGGNDPPPEGDEQPKPKAAPVVAPPPVEEKLSKKEAFEKHMEAKMAAEAAKKEVKSLI